MNNTATCPVCGREWDIPSEQAACIELFGECIPCRFLPDGEGSRLGNEADIVAIQRKADEQK